MLLVKISLTILINIVNDNNCLSSSLFIYILSCFLVLVTLSHLHSTLYPVSCSGLGLLTTATAADTMYGALDVHR